MRFICADRVFNGTCFLDKNSVLVLNEENELIDTVDSSRVDPLKLEILSGVITPGFINAHCHLELSFLKNVIPQKTGLVEFAKSVITKRSIFSQEEMELEMQNADVFMQHAGIAVVGDISNTYHSFKIKQKSKLYYHTFIELIGLDPKKSEAVLKKGIELLDELKKFKLSGSLAAHAPYSTSLDLMESISNYNFKNDLPFSIHNQESEEENKFLQGIKSDFHRLYEFLKMDISWFKPQYKSSLNAYFSVLKSKKNILVHNTFTSEADYESINDNIYWCLCPSANLYIENSLPDYGLLIKGSKQICFGTDSLASNTNLDILKEASIFYFQTRDLELTLKGLTSNAASALNLQHDFGSLLKGKNAGLNLIEIKQDKLLLKKVLASAKHFSPFS